MALRDFFLQNLNSMFPERLPGTAKGWDTSSSNREVCLDPGLSLTTEVYPSMAVKLTGRQGQTLYVVPCTEATDTPFGFIIYKAKNVVNRISRNQMATVGRMMQIMDFVMSGPVFAGEAVYQDPTTYMCSTDSSTGVYVGTALETVSSTADFPVIAAVEINIHGHGTKGESNVTSVNGLDGDVILTGANINATVNKANENTPTPVTQSINAHLQTISDNMMTLQGEIDTNAGKTAELDADVQKKIDKAQGVDNAGKVLTVGTDGNVELKSVTNSYLPDQAGHSGVLQTNGAVASWNDYIKVSATSILITDTVQPAINGQIVIGKGAGGVGRTGVDNVIIGNRASAGNYGIALGPDANAQAESSVQIGAGTNTEAGTMCVSVGTYPNQTNVTLLNNAGLIPYARITASFNQALSDTNKGATMADITPISTKVTTVESKIPAAASADNQLADKAFVNSSINNMAAFYITSDETGNAFATKAALDAGPWYFDGKARTPTTNDYAVVLADETHDGKTYRYSYTGTQWSAQYPFNNTTMTQAQVDAMNSGITAGKVTSYDAHLADEENPHKVTKAQVGLGNCDNTSDMDKPISTATQNALDLKVGKSDFASTLTEVNKGATLIDIDGLRGDYCSRYGVTASPNGRVRIGTGNQMIVPAGLQLTIPGANGEEVAPLVTITGQVTVPVTLTSDCVFVYVGGLDQPFQFCDKVCFSKIQPEDDESTCQLWFDGNAWHFRSINEGNVWVNVRAQVLAECIFTGTNLTRLNLNGWYHDMYSKLGDIETLLAAV